YPQHIPENNLMKFISNDNGETYNLNFEIGDLNFWRSKPYQDFFNHLDKLGGFFYERWGDAPVHSIAVGLFAQKSQVHFFNDIGYYHLPFQHCPPESEYHNTGRCHCDPKENF
ncbi:10175_t:CDS:2, partial [Gigaspora rosea]